MIDDFGRKSRLAQGLATAGSPCAPALPLKWSIALSGNKKPGTVAGLWFVGNWCDS
jgi:hypothetical protein